MAKIWGTFLHSLNTTIGESSTPIKDACRQLPRVVNLMIWIPAGNTARFLPDFVLLQYLLSPGRVLGQFLLYHERNTVRVHNGVVRKERQENVVTTHSHNSSDLYSEEASPPKHGCSPWVR